MNNDILEMERLLIAHVMCSPETLAEIELTEKDFGSVAHQTYWRCIVDCRSSGQPLTVFSVAEQFNRVTGTSDHVLFDYANAGLAVTSYQATSYAERIKKQSQLNKATAIASELIDKLMEGDTQSIDVAISSLMAIERIERNFDYSFSDVAVLIADEADKAVNGDTGAISTGYKTLDERIGGMFPGELVIVAARPAMGKTAWLINSFLKCGGRPGIISGEQGVAQIGVRSVCIDGRINHAKFRTGNFEESDYAKLTDATMRFKSIGGRIYDKPSPTMADVERICRQYVYKHGVNVVYIDYAQRIRHENGRLNRIDANTDIAQRLKELSRTLNVPIIALAQVNRQCEGRADKRPQMGDIADASAYEKEADVIMTLYRDEVYNPETPDRGIIEFGIEKNRHGGTGVIRMQWEGQYMNIDDFNAAEYTQEARYYGGGSGYQ